MRPSDSRSAACDSSWFVEVKKHNHPIKRELVQVLNQKLQSVGAQKAVTIATDYFQSGALEFARVHGISLVLVTEGRFTYLIKGGAKSGPLTRDEAFERLGLPTFVGLHFTAGAEPGTLIMSTVAPEYPERFLEMLSGQQATSG